MEFKTLRSHIKSEDYTEMTNTSNDNLFTSDYETVLNTKTSNIHLGDHAILEIIQNVSAIFDDFEKNKKITFLCHSRFNRLLE